MTLQFAPQSTTKTNRPARLLITALIGLAAVGVVAILLLPTVYRGLDEEWRERLKRRVPGLSAFDPTRAYSSNVLPTTAATVSVEDALSILDSDTATPAASATIAATPTPTAESIRLAAPERVAYLQASPTPTATPSGLTPTPTATYAPIPSSVRLNMEWEAQLWNNCGPANLVQVLKYYEWMDPQTLVADYLKPSKNDKNTSPDQLVAYVNNRTSIRALTRSAGDLTLIKQLVANKFGVILETGFIDLEKPEGDQWIGHYQTIIGYDDDENVLISLDTYKGVQKQDYTELDNLWMNFNRQYIVAYPASREAELFTLLGTDSDPALNAQKALQIATADAKQYPNDAFAWFNVATGLVRTGQYDKAAKAYDYAFSLNQLPRRLTWYEFGYYEAYFNTGRYDDVIKWANYNIESMKGEGEEPYYWLGRVYAAQGRNDEARAEYIKSLEYNKYFIAAKDALTALG